MSFSSKVLMVRPTHFRYNTETAGDNKFMLQSAEGNPVDEFEQFVLSLGELGIEVDVKENPDVDAPDAVFPNNWFSTHGLDECRETTLVLYPMKHPSRRRERRAEFVEALKQQYTRVIDLTHYESQDKALEGTGSLIFDRKNKGVFMCVSERADPELLHDLLSQLNEVSLWPWHPVVFESVDPEGVQYYHTNIMLAFTPKSAIINLASIRSAAEKEQVLLALDGYIIIDISYEQTNDMCGNLMTLYSPVKGTEVAVLSKSAEKHQLPLDVDVLYVDINTIQTVGGGSARCMIAEVY